MRRYLCLTDEQRGRKKKIIVDRKAEKYQCSKKKGEKKENEEMADKNRSLKRDKYKSRPIMVKREKIRGTGRLKRYDHVLAVCSLHKLKTKCLVELCGRGSLSYYGKSRQKYCCQQFCPL